MEKVWSAENWSEALKRNIIYAAHTYFCFLVDSNIQNVSDITEETIRRYIIQKASVMGSNSLNTIRRKSDYILYGRPQSNYSNIFLTSRPPVQPLERRGVYSAFNHVRKAAGLAKRPFHDLRRATGTSMVVDGIPVTTVAQVLGHTKISSTKQYISLDSAHLKECALGLAGIEQAGGTTFE